MTRRVQPTPRAAGAVRRNVAPRSDAQTRALGDLERWRRAAIPDATTPLEAEDLVRLLRECVAALRLDRAVTADVSVNTVHYYRRKDIIDPPSGKTVSARYDVRHLWQVAGARLAGHLGLATLAEARDAIRGANEDAALEFLASRVADARAREAVRDPQPIHQASREMRPLPNGRAKSAAAAATNAMVVTLPGDAWCVIPASHSALHSADAADALVRAFALALGSVKHS